MEKVEVVCAYGGGDEVFEFAEGGWEGDVECWDADGLCARIPPAQSSDEEVHEDSTYTS